MSEIIELDPCFTPREAARVRELLASYGGYPMYVEDVLEDAVGQGTIRRQDAVLNYVRGKLARGESPSMSGLSQRTNLFRGTFAQGEQILVSEADELLYRRDPFCEAAARITGCPVVVPDMLYANFLLPGQELPIHTDTPQYRGMRKDEHPEWLLVAMVHSGLFERWRVRIAGGVTFVGTLAQGGAFVVFPDGAHGEPKHIPAKDNTSVLLDADALFHGVALVGGEGAPAPELAPGMKLHMQPDGGATVRDGDRVAVAFDLGMVRASIQWKALCFASEDERRAYESHSDDLDVETVMRVLVADLRARGVLDGEPPAGTALAMLLVDTYVRFPGALPSSR